MSEERECNGGAGNATTVLGLAPVRGQRITSPPMPINVSDLRRGDILEIDGDPWQVGEVQSQTPSARGASMLIKTKIKNLRTGQSQAKTWRGGDMEKNADVDYRNAQFLYRQGDDFVFMDLASYEQFTLDADHVGDAAAFMFENLEVRTTMFQGRVIALILPTAVDLEVTETAPAIKGATAQAQLKPAITTTGAQVMVPSYIETGERIRVDTRDGRFLERSK
jgi:elongation factor P